MTVHSAMGNDPKALALGRGFPTDAGPQVCRRLRHSKVCRGDKRPPTFKTTRPADMCFSALSPTPKSCTPLATVQGKTVPLLVERSSHGAVVGTQSGLLEGDWNGHSLASVLSSGRAKGRVLNDYILRRNLPDEHQLVRSILNQ
jgi:hypothetical protein